MDCLKSKPFDMVYQFMQGYRAPGGADPQKAGEALEKIAEKHGRVEPDTVWKAAQRKNSPLHPYFTWDLKQAAIEHWRSQARSLIRAVVVVEPDEEEDQVSRVFTYAKPADDEKGGYYPTRILAQHPDLYQDAVRRLEQHAYSLMSSVTDVMKYAPAEKAEAANDLAAAAQAVIRTAEGMRANA